MKWRQSRVCLRQRLFEMANGGERTDPGAADRADGADGGFSASELKGGFAFS